jgi:hypothetical protein
VTVVEGKRTDDRGRADTGSTYSGYPIEHESNQRFSAALTFAETSSRSMRLIAVHSQEVSAGGDYALALVGAGRTRARGCRPGHRHDLEAFGRPDAQRARLDVGDVW